MGPLGAAAWLLLALATSSPSHPGGSIQLAAASSLIARAAQIPLSLPPWIKDAERPAVGHASGVEGVAASYLDSVSRAVGQEERVLRIQVPDDALQAEQLMRELEEHGFDIWKASKQHVDVRVTSSDDADATLAAHADRMQVLIPSIADLMRNEHTSQAAQLSALAAASLRTHDQHIGAPDTGVHSIYHPLSGIESLLQLFASDFPDFARLEEIGKSPEGKSVYVLSVSDYRASHADLAEGDEEHRSWREYSRSALKQMEREAAASSSKPAKKGKGNKRKIKKLGFSLLGGQHAREWISPATLLYVAHSLLVSAAAGDDETVLTALQDFEFHFVPVINPDGYEYSWTHDRLWVKNRQYTSSNDTRCHGIDLNRNWAYKFGKSYRPNPCSDLYPGEKPFEADELRILSDWLRKTKKEKDLHAFLDVHSFGQMLMYPYSYSCSVVPPDAENLNESLLGASKAIRGVHRLNYEVGSVCDVSYTATGQSLDWTYHEIGVKWSFSINLRDQGVYGFLLPPDQIVPSGQETLAGLLDLAMFIAKKEKIED